MYLWFYTKQITYCFNLCLSAYLLYHASKLKTYLTLRKTKQNYELIYKIATKSLFYFISIVVLVSYITEKYCYNYC